jgi:hypothetical protein
MRAACARVLVAVPGASAPCRAVSCLTVSYLAVLCLTLPATALLGAGCKRPDADDASGHASGQASTRASRQDQDAKPAVVHAAPERQRIVITDIAVHTVDPEVVRELYPQQLARQLGRALVTTDRFAAMAEHVPAGYEVRPASLAVRIHYDVIDADSAGAPTAVVAIEGTLTWEEQGARDPAPWDHLMVERPAHESADQRSHDELVAALASDGMERLAGRLAERERLRAGGDAALTTVLADPAADPSAVLWALDLVEHHGVLSLFEQVAAKLEAEAAEVRHHAVTTLAALDARRAVGAITSRVRFDDTEIMMVVIDTVAGLGGEDARAYLEFVASGHPEDEIRARAQAGMVRLALSP